MERVAQAQWTARSCTIPLTGIPLVHFKRASCHADKSLFGKTYILYIVTTTLKYRVCVLFNQKIGKVELCGEGCERSRDRRHVNRNMYPELPLDDRVAMVVHINYALDDLAWSTTPAPTPVPSAPSAAAPHTMLALSPAARAPSAMAAA